VTDYNCIILHYYDVIFKGKGKLFMVCKFKMSIKPILRNPLLIEGLPGIGFVANIAVLHLIRELGGKKFCEISSSSFQDIAASSRKGELRFPANELYYHKAKTDGRDLVLLYGNTQASTVYGQYELCGRVLDIAEELGCNDILTLGGLRREKRVEVPKIYCAASNLDTLRKALRLDVEVVKGHIVGVAGLLIGLCKIRGINGLCLLAETVGHPDAVAAREVLDVARRIFGLKVDLGGLDAAKETSYRKLRSFGLIAPSMKEEKKENNFSRWLI
jgi:uncharacterized protein (TIGR00162 family)